MRINLKAFKENYPVLEKKITLDQIALNHFLRNIYQEEIIRIENDQDSGCIQAQKISGILDSLGFKKAKELEEKFDDITHFQSLSNAQQSKEVCEAIAFVINSMETKQRANFMNFVADRELVCGPGTLANLQDIFQIVTGVAKNIDTLIANSKRTAIHNIIIPMYQSEMFVEAGFKPSIDTLANDVLDGAMEIHHIVRLGGVLQEYGMPPDGEMDEITASRNPQPCHDLILQAVDDGINADSIVDDVVNQIMLYMPKEASEDAFELYLQALRIGSVDDFLVKIDGIFYYRPNLQDRIKDLVTIYFAEELHRTKFQYYMQVFNHLLNDENHEAISLLLSELNITYNADELGTVTIAKRQEYISNLIKAPIKEKFQLVTLDIDELNEIKTRKELVMSGSTIGVNISAYDEDEIDWEFFITNRLKVRKTEDTPAIDSFLFCLINSITINGEHFLTYFIKENLNIGEQPALQFALDSMDTSIAEILEQLLTLEFLKSLDLSHINKKYWPILLKLGVDAGLIGIDAELLTIVKTNFSDFKKLQDFLEFASTNPLPEKQAYFSVLLSKSIEFRMSNIVAEILKYPEGRETLSFLDNESTPLLHLAIRYYNRDVLTEILKHIDGQDSFVKNEINKQTPLDMLSLENLIDLFQVEFNEPSVKECKLLQYEVLDIASTYLTTYLKSTELNSNSFLNNKYTCFFHEEEEIIVQKEATKVFIKMCNFLEKISIEQTTSQSSSYARAL